MPPSEAPVYHPTILPVTASLALPFPPDPADRAPLRPFAAPAVGSEQVLRVQQRLDVDDAFDPEILVQADVRLRVVAGRGQERTIEQTTTPVAVSAWTTLGPADPDQIPPQPTTAARWTRRADGSMAEFEVLEGGERPMAAALEATLGAARQLGSFGPPARVAPGGSWTEEREVTVPVATDDGSGALTLRVRAEHDFLGWASVGGARCALVSSDVHIDGGGAFVAGDRAVEIHLSARSAAWVWAEAATGSVVYLVSSSELTVGVGRQDDRPRRVATWLVAGPPPAPAPWPGREPAGP